MTSTPKGTTPAPAGPVAQFPIKLQFLFEPHRYKVLWGGRGGSKSWGIARALLIIGKQRTIRVLCAREFQNSIKDSVHKLLSDQIAMLGMQDDYEIQLTSIKCRHTGTEFSFEGIRQNVSKIKSYEGIDVCWVEEAHAVTKTSWDILIPTVRKIGSEIWVSFNPMLETDDTYQRFVVRPPDDGVVMQIGWRDNPWFTDTMRREKDYLRVQDPDAYLNVWEGKCRVMLEGAVYANELRVATASGHITKVPYEPLKPVHVFWDLGWADSTSLWFAQLVGFEIRVIDYVENTQKPIAWYLMECQQRSYVYGDFWLPHDARAKSLGTGKSIEEIVRASGRTVRIVPRLSVEDGINATRTMFPNIWFDSERCVTGLNALRHYRYEVISEPTRPGELGALSRQPVHDWASHGADGFRYLAVGLREKPSKGGAVVLDRVKAALRLSRDNTPGTQHSWMKS